MRSRPPKPMSLTRWRYSRVFRITSLALLLDFAAFQNAYGQVEFQLNRETGAYQPLRPVSGGAPSEERSDAPDSGFPRFPANLWDDHPLSRATSEAEDPDDESISEERAVTRAAIKYTIKKTFYSNKKLKTWDKRGTKSGKLVKRWFKTYDSKRKITRYLTQDYYSNGKLKVSNDLLYNAGKLKNRYYKTYDSKGKLTRSLSQTYSADEI